MLIYSDAPYAGARIETTAHIYIAYILVDAPYAGARIETIMAAGVKRVEGCPLCGGEN